MSELEGGYNRIIRSCLSAQMRAIEELWMKGQVGTQKNKKFKIKPSV